MRCGAGIEQIRGESQAVESTVVTADHLSTENEVQPRGGHPWLGTAEVAADESSRTDEETTKATNQEELNATLSRQRLLTSPLSSLYPLSFLPPMSSMSPIFDLSP